MISQVTQWFQCIRLSEHGLGGQRHSTPMPIYLRMRLLFMALVSAPLAVFAQESTAIEKLGVGLYGSNGHQLNPAKLAAHPHARLVAVAAVRIRWIPQEVKRYATLDDLIADPQVELISLCSPVRANQARDAIRCLQAGKHVYAEKPAALTETELERILAAAKRSGKQFHEMADTAFGSNYATIRQLVREGAIGEVVQIFAQKSFRYGDARPQDEAIDGGMFLQGGMHAARMIEHVAAARMKTITAWETTFGKPVAEKGDGKIAGVATIELENGGLATIIVNYLNPANTPLPHANDMLRIFGTNGMIESVDGGTRTRLVTSGRIVEPLAPSVPGQDYFDFVVAHLATGAAMPLTLEEELHPLRMLVRAKEKLRAARAGRGN